MFPVSSRFLAAVAASYNVAVLATVVDSTGKALGTLPVNNGNLTVDETAAVRRSIQLTLAVDDPSLIPSAPGDLLDPLAGHELHISQGVAYQDGTTELAPLGVFRLSKPLIHVGPDGQHINLTGQDRSWEIARRTWTDTYTVAGGTNLADAVKAIIESVFPGLTYNFAPTDFALPKSVYTPGGSVNRWQAVQALATAGGMEVFFDPQGVVVMRPIVNPSTTAPALTIADGAAGTLVQVERDLDTSKTYNGVITVGQGSSGAPPVRGEAWITSGPLSDTGPMGKVPYYMTSSTITTQSQAVAAAQAQLLLVGGADEDVTAQMPPNGALDAGDVATVICAAAKVNKAYALRSFQMPIGAGSGYAMVAGRGNAMSITMRPSLTP